MKAQTRVIVVLVAIAIYMSFLAGFEWNNDMVPYCKEDAVLVGKDSFENGRWTHYECGPSVDDYKG